MMKDSEKALFHVVGMHKAQAERETFKAPWYRGKPLSAAVVLGMIVLGCLVLGPALKESAVRMELDRVCLPPGKECWFGTDSMGRDLFAMIWYGGGISLSIGFLATAISTGIAVVFGTACGIGPRWLDGLLMRFAEIFLSVPTLLLTIFVQAAIGKPTVLSLSVVIGITGWPGMAKVVRAEVRRLLACEFVVAARCMGGGFFYVLRRHLAPNFFSSILFMIVMNIQGAMAAESALSFMGIGLPLEVISWGSMLSLAKNALTAGDWWMIVIPGGFLVATLLCVTEIAGAVRGKGGERKV